MQTVLSHQQIRGLPVIRARTTNIKIANKIKKLALKAGTEQNQKTEEDKEKWAIDEDNCAYNISGEYCSIDLDGKRIVTRSVGEMELQFLQALREFYYDGETQMSNEEFDALKEELLWNGSRVARLSPDEQRFIEVTSAFNEGKSIITDDEYDELKGRLRAQASWVTSQGPRCSLRSQKMYSDARADYLKMTLLNLPAAVVVLFGVYVLDAETNFKITALLEYPEPWGAILLWLGFLPLTFLAATKLTNIAFKDNVILSGPCPNCGEVNESYFGDILVIKGSRTKNIIECSKCKGTLEYNNFNRLITYDVDATEQKKESKIKKERAAEARKNKTAQKTQQEEQKQKQNA